MIRGSVDSVSSTEIRGWAFSPGLRNGLLVQAILSHELLGEVVANEHRSDLAAAGLGDGNCGFTIPLLRPIDPSYLPFVAVRPEGGTVELPRSTLSGFYDYFRSIYASYPASGRQRTVLGGLWTDRTDASAILKGKQSLDLVMQAEADRLSGLVHEGFCTVDVGVRTPDHEAAAIQALIERPALLDLLHAVFEDKAVVLRSEVVDGDARTFTQPSLNGAPGSPAECVAVIVSLGARDVALDVVRGSHAFPEFTRDGKSRWVERDGVALGDVVPLEHAQLDRVMLNGGMAAVIGAGTIYRLNSLQNRKALRLFCIPARAMPVVDASRDGEGELVTASGARILMAEGQPV